MITIISKIELEENNNLLYTEVGYTEDQNVTDSLNIQYDETLGQFLAKNRTKLQNKTITISDFFVEVSFVYEARTMVNEIDKLDLKEIKTLNDL